MSSIAFLEVRPGLGAGAREPAIVARIDDALPFQALRILSAKAAPQQGAAYCGLVRDEALPHVPANGAEFMQAYQGAEDRR